MRLLLALALVLQVSGVPATAATPCASPSAGEHECCIRHHTETGGAVIGHCGCRVEPQPESTASVSTAPASPDRGDDVHVPVPAHVTPAPVRGCVGAIHDIERAGPGESPPLSATGLRC